MTEGSVDPWPLWAKGLFLTLLGLVAIKLQMCKKKVTIEFGDAAQKGRYERETHTRYRPDGKKNAKI